MTDMESSQSNVTPSTIVDTSSTTSHASEPSAPVQEKLLKQSEVNDIVGRAKHEAVERFKREQSRQVDPNTETRNISHDDIRRMAAEEASRLRNEWVQEQQRIAGEKDAERIAGEFFTKLGTGKERYQDFDKTIENVDFAAIPNIVQLSNMVDNTADVMYELAKNPSKIATLQQLISISPKLAYSEMQRLSSSIKDNANVSNYKSPNDPLSQMKPSNTGTDAGALTVTSLRSKYRV